MLAQLWNGAVQRCILLNKLTRPELDFVLSATRPIVTREGDVIYEEGDLPTCFYLVARGRYRAPAAASVGDRAAGTPPRARGSVHA